MTDLLFVDTNILIYTLDPADAAKRATATELVADGLLSRRMVTSPQALNECYRVTTARRGLLTRADARVFVESLFPICRARLTLQTIGLAWEIEDTTNIAWWDCLLLASGLLAGCSVFLTEDMHHGQTIRGMRLVNPFLK